MLNFYITFLKNVFTYLEFLYKMCMVFYVFTPLLCYPLCTIIILRFLILWVLSNKH